MLSDLQRKLLMILYHTTRGGKLVVMVDLERKTGRDAAAIRGTLEELEQLQ